MTRIVDFASKDEGVGTLTNLRPRIDPGQDDARMWDADIVFEISEDDADHVSLVVPAARTYLDRAMSKVASATIKVQPVARDVRLSFATDKGVPVLDQVAAEVRHLTLRVQPQSQVFIAKLRIFALNREQSADLVMLQGKSIRVTVEPQQQGFEWGAGDPKVGDIVSAKTGDDDVFGVYKGKKGNGHLVDDFGVIHQVDEIVSRLHVVDDGRVLQTAFKGECEMADQVPTWRLLVIALGKSFAAGEKIRNTSGHWLLTDGVVKRALELGLPPEADEGEDKNKASG